ncbi:MAG: type I methionyl aminopeptidase [Chloroflexi bacterium]|nr:type I methionyl aminopeptidase [Chloroflexota bacterium]
MAITIKSPAELELMRRAGQIVAATIATLVGALRPGMRTADLDSIAEREIRSRGGTPSFLGYKGYPASICVSVNEEIVHGIPGQRVLKEGDVVSLDVGAIYQGWQGDGAVTVGVGRISEEARQLIAVTRGALEAAIKQARPGVRLGDIGATIQQYVESRGYSVVREYVGHGIGRQMHEEPQVPNYGVPGRGLRLVKGMCLAIEPMVNIGDWHTRVGPDQWTIFTVDGSLSAHFEHTIAVLEEGAEVLTRLSGSDDIWAHTLGLPTGVSPGGSG